MTSPELKKLRCYLFVEEHLLDVEFWFVIFLFYISFSLLTFKFRKLLSSCLHFFFSNGKLVSFCIILHFGCQTISFSLCFSSLDIIC